MMTDSDRESNPIVQDAVPEHRPTKVFITVRIPSNYHQEPVISHLISHYYLTVIITGASLGEKSNVEGWFNLELRGLENHIQGALLYLNDIDAEVWNRTDNEEEEGW